MMEANWRVRKGSGTEAELWFADNGPGLLICDRIVLGPFKTDYTARLAVEARLLTDQAEIQSMELEATRSKVTAFGHMMSRLEQAFDVLNENGRNLHRSVEEWERAKAQANTWECKAAVKP